MLWRDSDVKRFYECIFVFLDHVGDIFHEIPWPTVNALA